jgi:hypothetical protein
VNTKTLKYVVIGLYMISLFTESFSGSGGVYGVYALIFGGLSILIGNFVAFGAWTANILFMIAFFRRSKLYTKLTLSGIAVLLGFLAVFVTDLPMHMGSSTSPVKIGIGFYFWFASLISLFVKNLTEYIKLNKE